MFGDFRSTEFFIFYFYFFLNFFPAFCDRRRRPRGAPRGRLREKKRKKNFFYFFIFFLSLATPRSTTGSPAPITERRKKIKIKKKLFFYFFIFFRTSGLTPRTSAGLSHGSPSTSSLLTPTSYLYYYIRLLMSLISLFLFALTFGKPLNYFTCEKEDF
jgi:hypothetical protein